MTPPSRGPAPLYLLLGSGVVIVVLLLIVATAKALLLLFAGVLFAIVLHGCCEWLARVTRLRRELVLSLVLLLGLAAFVGTLVFAAPRLSEQFTALSHDAPKLLDRAREVLQRSAFTRHLLPAAPPAPAGNPQPGELLHAAAGALGGSLELLGGIAIVFFIGVYGAAQPELYARTLVTAAPAEYRGRLEGALSRARHDLSRWMVGRLIAMLFVGVTSGVMFALLHLPAALLLGVFAGVLTFVEYAGALISALPPIALAAAQGPGRALAVLVLFMVLHVIEGYVLTPLLARASVHFPPALALAAQVLFGVLLGPLGLTFSTPLVVLVVSGVKGWREAPC